VATMSHVAGWLLSLDDEASFTRAVVRRSVRKAGTVTPTDEPGVVFLEVDGCSHGVLQRAMRAGWTPNLAAWLRSGHRLERWHTDLSSQTGASQAGLLLGTNEGIVAFRWWERDRDAIVVSSNPTDAMLLEDRLGTGDGLLAGGGASRNNLLAGDAANASMTLSRLRRPGGASRVWSTYFANPNNVMRTILNVVADVTHEFTWNVRYRRRGVEPRLKKGWRYPLVRAATTVVMRDIATEMVVGDIVRGAPAIYVTFVGYDEVAHHDGVERAAALEQLRLLDRTFARIARARRFAPRPYHVVVLSDHGQSQGSTFLQRYGLTLEQLVRDLVGGARVEAFTDDVESVAQLSGSLGSDRPLTGSGRQAVDHDAPDSASDLLVMASGCLGLVYFRRGERRATRAELDERFPGLVAGVAAHPGVGFVLVAGDDGEGYVIGRDGVLRLSDGTVNGTDPLAPYGPYALRQLQRHHGFEHVPDLLVMARWDSERGEVPAFEELIGSHGGMGGEQTEPFVLFPDALEWPEGEELLGAGAVHQVLKGWTPAGRARQ